MTKKNELVKSIFNLMTDREQNIFYQLDDDNPHFLKEMGKFYKSIESIMKAKGILKKEKLKNKALKKLKESSKNTYMTVHASMETYVFHLLLDCVTRIAFLTKYRTKIYDLFEEKEDFDDTEKNIGSFDIEFTERITKKLISIDTRCSNFLKSIIEYNDMVINHILLENKIDDSKKSVDIKSSAEIKYFKKEYEFLKEITKSAILGSTCMNELTLKYNEKIIKEFKYNFSRIKTFSQDLEKELIVFDLLFNCGKYKELILKSFLSSNEKMTHENVESYLNYLTWLDKKGKLNEEYELFEEN